MTSIIFAYFLNLNTIFYIVQPQNAYMKHFLKSAKGLSSLSNSFRISESDKYTLNSLRKGSQGVKAFTNQDGEPDAIKVARPVLSGGKGRGVIDPEPYLSLFIRKTVSDEMDHKKWDSRISTAIICCIGVVAASIIINLVIGYYK